MRSSRVIPVVLALLASCGPPARPATPAPGSIPGGLCGKWQSGPYGMDLKLTCEGEFVWDQEGVHKEGWFGLDGSSLVFTVQGGYKTVYTLVEMSADNLVIRDPAGTTVTLDKSGTEPDATKVSDSSSVAGVWGNPTYQLRIELGQDGSFVWKQGSLVETGTWKLGNGTVLMTTGGHTSTYRIDALGASKLVLSDPAGNPLELTKVEASALVKSDSGMGKDQILGGKPTIKIVNLEGGGSKTPATTVLEAIGPGTQIPPPAGCVVGPGGLFYFVPPDGFKVDTQKVCGNKITSLGKVYSCWNRNDMYAPDSTRLHFDLRPFVTWAAPGALDRITPDIDGFLGGFEDDRTSVSDEIWEMAGMEVFSTRIDGRSISTGKQMRGRILGVHYGDLLVVGVLAISGDPEAFANWGADVQAILDSMSFYLVEGKELASSLEGSWSSDQGDTLTLKAGGKYSRGEETGSWLALGSTLLMVADPAAGEDIEAHPAQVVDGSLNLDGVFFEKQL